MNADEEGSSLVAVQHHPSFIQYWSMAFGGWLRVLSMRFFKGIRDGLMFTPLIEIVFWVYRTYVKKGPAA
jgi:hypothetical protein